MPRNTVMVILLYFFIIILNAVSLLSGKKNILLSIYSFLFIVLFVIGKRFDGTTIMHDLESYERKYEFYEDLLNPFEFSFRIINTIGNNFGLSFEGFYMIVTAVIISLLFYTIIKLRGNVHLFVVAFMLYFISVTISQIRNQCAMVTLFALLPWAISYDNFTLGLWGKIKIAFCLLLASSFHASYLVFLLPFLAANERKFVHLKALSIFLTLAFVALFFLKQVSFIQIMVMLFIADTEYLQERFGDYAESTTGFISLVPITIYVLLLLGLYFWKKRIISSLGDKKMVDFSNYIFNVVLWSSSFLPLLLLNATFYRYTRDISLLGIICLGIGVSSQVKRKTTYKLFALMITIPIGWFIFDVVIKGYWDEYSKHFFDTLFL